mgnify:CR=1 FL=1
MNLDAGFGLEPVTEIGFFGGHTYRIHRPKADEE